MALEICVVDRPHLNPLPRGEDFTNHAFRLAIDHRANPAASISKDAETVSPSPWGEGRDEGGRSNTLKARQGWHLCRNQKLKNP